MTTHETRHETDPIFDRQAFLQALQTAHGSVVEVLEQYPELGRTFNSSDWHEDPTDLSETGQPIQCNGFMYVTRHPSDKRNHLTFYPLHVAGTVDLGTLEDEEADAVNRFGTALMTVDIQMESASQGRRTANLLGVHNVQRPTNPAQGIKEGEQLLFVGTVEETIPDVSQETLVGAAALSRVVHTNDNYRQSTALRVRLPDGQTVDVHSAAIASTTSYRNAAIWGTHSLPMVGDQIVVSATRGIVSDYGTSGYIIRDLSLAQPNEPRQAQINDHQQSISTALERAERNGSPLELRAALTQLLRTAFFRPYVTANPMLGFNDEQWRRVQRTSSAEQHITTSERHIALECIEHDGILGGAALEDQAVLAMTRAEFKAYVEHILIYGGQQEPTEGRLALAEVVFDEHDIANLAVLWWKATRAQMPVLDNEQLSTRLDNLETLLSTKESLAIAELVHDVVKHPDIPLEQAYSLLAERPLYNDVMITPLSNKVLTFREYLRAYLALEQRYEQQPTSDDHTYVELYRVQIRERLQVISLDIFSLADQLGMVLTR